MDVPGTGNVVEPVTIPDTLPIAATLVLLLLHMPPVIPSFKTIDDPAHKVAAPLIKDGVAYTVTSALEEQPPIE